MDKYLVMAEESEKSFQEKKKKPKAPRIGDAGEQQKQSRAAGFLSGASSKLMGRGSRVSPEDTARIEKEKFAKRKDKFARKEKRGEILAAQKRRRSKMAAADSRRKSKEEAFSPQATKEDGPNTLLRRKYCQPLTLVSGGMLGCEYYIDLQARGGVGVARRFHSGARPRLGGFLGLRVDLRERRLRPWN